MRAVFYDVWAYVEIYVDFVPGMCSSREKKRTENAGSILFWDENDRISVILPSIVNENKSNKNGIFLIPVRIENALTNY